MFTKITALINAMNNDVLYLLGVKFETCEEYAIEYLETLIEKYSDIVGLDNSTFVNGKGHRRSIHQKQYEEMAGYISRLKNYARHIEICCESRNSYSKTDHDATFMRIKTDYMGNDRLLPAYNMQIAICDEYIAAVDAKPYASDMECLVPLMEKIYECEDCTGCPYKDDCCRKAGGNRTAHLNRELTAIHREVIDNLESIHGALLRMNRSIQAEGTFGTIKWNRTYKRLFRRGEKAVLLEFTLISCGFNLYKYHNKKNRLIRAA